MAALDHCANDVGFSQQLSTDGSNGVFDSQASDETSGGTDWQSTPDFILEDRSVQPEILA
jgi:hypothetical protein